MKNAYNQFNNNIKKVKELHDLFVFLKEKIGLPNDLTDLLRAEIVYLVSALDKFIHELIRIGMIESFHQTRNQTQKFLSFGISFEIHNQIINSSSLPPPEYWFEQEIIKKHKTLSFQDPDKIADGLSFIWDESHKWQVIATDMGLDQNQLKTKLKTIIARRNQIVHEADINVLSGDKYDITKEEIEDITEFIINLSEKIYNNVVLQ